MIAVTGEGLMLFVRRMTTTSTTIPPRSVFGKDLVNKAVDMAAASFPLFAELPGVERGKYLLRAAQELESNIETLATLETSGTRRPLHETRCSVLEAASCLRYFGNLAATVRSGTLMNTHFTDSIVQPPWLAYTRREPLGVCVGIGAWNYPLEGLVWKLAPAIATGNSFIFKPDEKTTHTALALQEMLNLPTDVYQVVCGGADVGELLVRNERVAKIAFTGSRVTGQKVNRMAAKCRNLKRVTLELGGKSPLIVCDDVSVRNAAKIAIDANFYSTGQICSNGTRVFVQSDMADAFVAEVVRQTQQLKIGDPFSNEVDIGPLVSSHHAHHVIGYIQRALDEGAILQCGGDLSMSISLDGREDTFITPCILTGVKDFMEVCREEVFGPVMSILEYDNDDEVIERANASDYGLAAGVLTNNIQKAHKFVNKLKAGITYVNTYNLAPPQLPWGGFRNSGLGRENGEEVMYEYTEVKSICMDIGNKI
eukprot:m.131050 g.131050  ORF g.131050 m.131050 type:complete len:482 (+) comp9475_c0_seq3:437-1882(+)